MIPAILFVALILSVVYLFLEHRREKRRNRILQAFVAGLIKSTSDYISETDKFDIAEEIIKSNDKKFPIPYNELLENINREFLKDFWTAPYWKWIKKDRNLFYENRYANDGFNMIYWDLVDKELSEINEAQEKENKANSQQGHRADRR